jgi:hypothetical protein
MKHKSCKYVWNNTWQAPAEQGIWFREKYGERIALSRCTLGNHVLSLNFAVSAGSPGGFYNFTICDGLDGSPVFHCGWENNLQFDTDDIDLAERTAEYIWKQTLFYEDLKWAPERTFRGTRWKRIHWGIRG